MVPGTDQDDRPEGLQTTDQPVAVLLVDDQESFRAAAREIVTGTDGFMLAGEVESGEAALELIEQAPPDLVIMDKRMPGMGGLAACRLLTTRHPETVVVLASVEEADEALGRSCGAAASVQKQELSRGFLRAVWREHGPRRSDAR